MQDRRRYHCLLRRLSCAARDPRAAPAIGIVWRGLPPSLGDIDAGGVRIGRFLEESLPLPVVPHLMTDALALSSGRAVPPLNGMENVPTHSAFALLARFLASDSAHILEQEVLDPQPIR